MVSARKVDPDGENGVPKRAVYLTAGLLILGAAGGAASIRLAARPGVAWGAVAALFLLLTVSGMLFVRFQYREQTVALDLFEAALAPAIFLLSGPVVVAAVAGALALSNVLRRNRLLKAAFNVGQYMLAASVGSMVFAAVRSGPGLTGRNVGAIALAMATVSLIIVGAVTQIIRFTQRETFQRALTQIAPSLLISYVVNTGFGLLFVVGSHWSMAGVGLFFIPLLTLHWAYKGHAAASADRARLRGMHRASTVLAAPVVPAEAVPAFLDEVRECFSAETVCLVTAEHGRGTLHLLGRQGYSCQQASLDLHAQASVVSILFARGIAEKVTPRHRDPALAAALARDGWRDCLAAPLFEGDRVVGLLCTFNRLGLEGFEDGELSVLQALALDVATTLEKGRLLREVFAERQKFSDIVEGTSDGIFTLLTDGTIGTWSPAMERISGYPAATMVGSRSLALLTPRDADGVAVVVERWATGDGERPPGMQITARSGEQRWLACSYSPAPSASGALVVVARDATRARETERLKDDFMATVSHELRTPLTPIKAWASTMSRLGASLDEDQRKEGIDTILRQTERLERLISNLLDVAKIERGVGHDRDVVVDVREILNRVVDQFRRHHPGRVIRLTSNGSTLARGDEIWIEQIVTNLLSNALKYSPATEPTEVRVGRERDGVEVHVVDRGTGIARIDADRVFERFQRLGDYMTRSQSGAGLGLYIARQLAEAIGGTLNVESSPGSGSTFVLRLRRAETLVAVG